MSTQLHAPNLDVTEKPRLRCLLRAALWSIGIVWALGIAALVALFGFKSQPGLLQPGQPAPLFTLADQDGHTHNLADYHGRGVVVSFLPGLDPASVAQLRSLNTSIKEFDAMGVKVFAVSSQPAANTKPLHDREKLQFPILTDKGSNIATQYRTTFGPGGSGRLSYVVGQKGSIMMPVTNIQTSQHGAQMVAMSACCMEDHIAPTSRFVGKTIPDATLTRADTGKPDSLYGTMSSQATVVLFQSAHCPCSAGYDARARALSLKYAGDNVRFVAINSSHGETASETAAHFQSAHTPYPVLMDPTGKVADRFGATVTPEAFVLDTHGVLRYHGRLDDSRDADKVTSNDLQNALDAVLAGKHPARPDIPAFGCAIARQ